MWLRAAIVAATSSKGCGCAQRSSQRQAARDVVACSDHRSAASSDGYGFAQRSSKCDKQQGVGLRAAIIAARQAATGMVSRSDHRSATSSKGRGFAQR
jgi:hypothetical protein